MELFKFNDGLFAGKEVRTKNGYVSVLDIICVATSHNIDSVRKTYGVE